MSWGEAELEPELRDWYLALDEANQARVHLNGRPTRITYWIASGRRIILLTVFVKTQRRERREVERAKRAYERCLAEGHTAEEDD